MTAEVEQVLDTMFFLTVLSHSESAPERALPVSAGLEFRGEPSGAFGIRLSEPAARVLSANFLGAEPDELSSEQISEVVRELANIMCGAILTRVHGDSLFELTAPELQDPERAATAAARGITRTFDVGDGVVQAYLQVN